MRYWHLRNIFNRSSPTFHISIALAISLVFWLLGGPAGPLYPLRLLVTMYHEAGHALAALATGGDVSQFVVRPDASGVVFSRGGYRPLVISAGYVGTALLGALLVVFARTPDLVRGTLFVLGAATATSALLIGFGLGSWHGLVPLYLGVLLGVWATRARFLPARVLLLAIMAAIWLGAGAYLGQFKSGGSSTVWLILIIDGLAMVIIAGGAPSNVARFSLALVAVQICLNALWDIKYVHYLAKHSQEHTDAISMAKLMGGTPASWVITWAVLALCVVAAAFWRAYAYYQRCQRRALAMKDEAEAVSSTRTSPS
jgi:hypothetical protein